MQKNNPTLIFDLDGTILSVSSFPHWALFMLFGKFGGLTLPERILLSLRTGLVLMRRKLLRRSHHQTKRSLQFLWADALRKDKNQSALKVLTSALSGKVRPNLADALKAVASGETDAVLATAAAGEYAVALGQALGFRHILATPLCEEKDVQENCRERKRDRVIAFLAAQGWNDRERIFFTDHLEDLPLIKESDSVVWFGNDKGENAIRAYAPEVEIISGLALSQAGIISILQKTT